jgi:glycerol-3-phosphate dehydrogenase (NAD(P)+)
MVLSKRQFVSELVKKTLGDSISFCVLSGPSFAEEIIKRNPTVVVVASENQEVKIFKFLFKINVFFF